MKRCMKNCDILLIEFICCQLRSVTLCFSLRDSLYGYSTGAILSSVPCLEIGRKARKMGYGYFARLCASHSVMFSIQAFTTERFTHCFKKSYSNKVEGQVFVAVATYFIYAIYFYVKLNRSLVPFAKK